MVTVSVCILTYNHENYIVQTLKSVFEQVCDFKFEIILSNDCSTDGTHEIITSFLKEYKQKACVNYFNHVTNLGMMTNFKFALKQCKGKYIALCDGDDFWIDPLKLQKQVDFMETHPNYAIHSGIAKIEFAKPSHDLRFIGEEAADKSYVLEDFYGRNHLVTCTVLFRNCITHWPRVFEDVTLGDWFLYVLVLNHSGLKAYKSKTVYSVYRVLSSGVMNSLKPIAKHNGRLKQIFIIKDYLGYKSYPLQVKKCINANSIAKVRVELSHKMYKAALLTFFKNLYYCKHRISVRKYFSALKHDFK
ncbi:glycosyltransferase family 2 protein [Aestuariibaculum lutulentum]|uniref:Glycosyltransferase n=1 Tax=Aestuariibaculum lutulentum TaxID=2920935 RepID=A0ABS9RE78_9FLAO|nr:glycosyltransferase family 2 protein [Aestuariibaculum lutulentum]MCH4551251.1 glycosyltransferase [Aestuariibaculum lutulentum]